MTTATLAGPRRVADNGERRRLDDEFLTRREAETLIEAADQREQAAKETHQTIHDAQQEALRTALTVADRDRVSHDVSHDREHVLHEHQHAADKEAVRVALDAVARERQIHSDAHAREHASHANEHALNNLAITKAEKATDDRFSAANAYREQINELVRRMVTRDQMDVMVKEHDRRYEEMRTSIINLEKGDLGDRSLGRGRAIGQGVVIAAIVGVVSFIATVLAIFIGVMNVVTT